MRAQDIELTLARSNDLLLQLCKHQHIDDKATVAFISELTRIRNDMLRCAEYMACERIGALEKSLMSQIPNYIRTDSPTSIEQTTLQFE